MPDHRQLESKIINLSRSNDWVAAQREWEIQEIYWAEDPGTCLCGRYPINEICVLLNKTNGNQAVVGNECVKQFMELPSQALFAGVKRIASSLEAALNFEVTEHAKKKGWINDWEYNFCNDTRRRRRDLTEKQAKTRFEINGRVLRHVQKKGLFRVLSG